MDLRKLRYFVAVAEELHFRRAAERLGIAQPPLSQQIRQLEDWVGAKLLSRTSRRVELTEAGAAFLRETRKILEGVEAARSLARRVAEGKRGRVVVGAIGPALDTFLPGIISQFIQRHPEIELTLNEMRSHHQLDQLRAGHLDIGFLQVIEQTLTGLVAHQIVREPYMLAIPESHGLAARKRIALRQLKDQPMILAPRQNRPRLRDRIVACCREAGFEPRIVQEAVTKRTEVALVAAAVGIALVPASYRNVPQPGVVYRTLMKSSLPQVEVAAVWRDKLPRPALAELLKIVRGHGPG